MNLEQKLEKTTFLLKDNLKTLRVGRASSGLVENIEVEAYGNTMPLNQVASISIPQNNQILITPWDPDVLPTIEKAIIKSNLQINPVSEGGSIRLTLPPLTEETRKELTKEVAKYAEETRISIRNIREEEVKELESSGISEDEKFRKEKELQQLIDKFNAEVKEIQQNKEAEILEL